MRAPSMADLTDKTRVRHVHWGSTGTIRAVDGSTEVRWDNSFVADEVSPEGVVFPSDLEILR